MNSPTDFFYTEEQNEIKYLTRKIAEEKILPIRAEFDENETFPREILAELARADLFRVFIPESYDGLGGGASELSIVTEELSRICGGIAICYAASGLGSMPLLLHANEQQKKKYLPQIASGEKLAAFAITEAEAGSDSANIKTKAVLKGNRYILNGTKQFITSGSEADIYVVFVTTNPGKGIRGLSAVIVEKGAAGFSFGKKEKKLGIRASITTELVFDDCEIPKENLIGGEGRGFRIAMDTFDHSRPGVASQAIGIAQGAFEAAADYASKRIQFDQAIINFQGIGFMLADMETSIQAARSFNYTVAKYIDSGAKDIGKFSAMTKVFASDVAMKVTTDAVQILGGYGYMKDYPVEKMMRDAKITQIYEGTNQIQRSIIMTKLIHELAQKK
ncbi:acyl-CoA dehydrogenase family protein [candidate division WOR-3 bacterium]|nr:acyl-CoA dehydrogenase family protein [candidate division WOR-3 bacterium]